MAKKYRTVEVDLTAYDTGKPHWLSPQGQHPEIFERNRAKHRALAQAQKKMDKVNDKLGRVERRLKDPAK
jgi:hypothetical protein